MQVFQRRGCEKGRRVSAPNGVGVHVRLLEEKCEMASVRLRVAQRDLEPGAVACRRKQARMRRVGQRVRRSSASARTISSAAAGAGPRVAGSQFASLRCSLCEVNDMAVLPAKGKSVREWTRKSSPDKRSWPYGQTKLGDVQRRERGVNKTNSETNSAIGYQWGFSRLATVSPLSGRQEAEQAAAITARFVSLLLLALSTNAAPKFQ